MGTQYSEGSLGPHSSAFAPVLNVRESHNGPVVDENEDDDLMPISVAVRVCPKTSDKQEESSCIWLGSAGKNDIGSSLRCCGPSGDRHAFQFSNVYAEDIDQKTVFQQSLEPLLSILLQGYDVCVFAYGQTGSGKSYTLSGPDSESQLEANESDFGLILRSIRYIFQSVGNSAAMGPVFSDDDESSFEASLHKETVCDLILKVSFMKVDNQGIRDLLSDHGAKLSYKRQPDGNGIVLEGLKEVECNSTEEVWSLYQMGRRIFKGNSGRNPQQRGHTIFTLDLTILERNCRKKSSIKFVELVPSDLMMLSPTRPSSRQDGQGPHPTLQVHQGTPRVEIGLLSLDGVVAALGDPRTKVSHAQFNNSFLTSLLRDAFGGPCVTLAICCISQAISDAKQTLDTLTFAWRLSNIQNKPVPNVDPINIGQSVEEEIDDFLESKTNGSRRPSGLSELRSVSATDGRMPDLFYNANVTPQLPLNNNSIWVNQESQLIPPLLPQQASYLPHLAFQHSQAHQHLLQQQMIAHQAYLHQMQAFQQIFPGPSSFPSFPQRNYYQELEIYNQAVLQQQQLAFQAQKRHQLESPFMPISANSPMPENSSPLSKQASPLPVSLYLQPNCEMTLQTPALPKLGLNCQPEKMLAQEVNPVSLAVNLVPVVDELESYSEKKKKIESRRSSLATQTKLTQILEESDCEASSPSANSSKLNCSLTEQFISACKISNGNESGRSTEDETNDSSEEFDSECSVCSDYEPTIKSLVVKFEEETLKTVESHEKYYFDLEVDRLLRNGGKTSSRNVFEPSKTLSEIHQNIISKRELLGAMMSQDAEISSSKNHLQSFARNLVEELSDMENELLDTRSFNQASDSSKGNIQAKEIQMELETLRNDLKTILMKGIEESDVCNSPSYKHLQERLQFEESNKAYLLAELQQGKQTIDKLQSQILHQEEHLRLSLQISQELNQQKERLAIEEARLEQVRLETESLHKSLLTHQAELENKSKKLFKSFCQNPLRGDKKTEEEVHGEVEIFREIRKSLVEERKWLEHFLSHGGVLTHCSYCQNGVPSDASGDRDSSQNRRAVELDCLVEAVDCIIDFKSDILCGRENDYSDSSDHPDNPIINMLCKLPIEECRALVHKFVLRCIDLRHDGVKHDDKVEQLLWELGQCHVNDKDLRDQMSTMKFDYERQLEIQKREHKKKEALMNKCFKETNQRVVDTHRIRHRDETKERREAKKPQHDSIKASVERLSTGERKPSDTGSSELGPPDPCRVKKFQRLVQLNHAQAERSKVIHLGKKLIIEQPQ